MSGRMTEALAVLIICQVVLAMLWFASRLLFVGFIALLSALDSRWRR